VSKRAASSRTSARDYPRTARINELLREIIAEAIEDIDDDRLHMVAVTGIEAEPDLRHATVFIDTLSDDDDAVVTEALDEHRARIQRAIGRQSHIKRTPVLRFEIDPAVRGGERIDTVLRSLPPLDSDSERDGED
jgi:ribosome-binding factor A